MPYQIAKQHLIDGNTKAALDAIGPALEGTGLYDEWAMLRARYRRMRESEMKGTQSTQEINLEHNRINDALLRLIGRASQKEPATDSGRGVEQTSQGRPAWINWGIGVILLVVIVLAIRPLLKEGVAKEGTENTPTTAKQELPKSGASESKSDEGAESVDLQLVDQYYIGKVSGNRDLPFEIHTLRKGKRGLFFEITIKNQTGKSVKLGEVELLHTKDKSKAISKTLEGEVLETGAKRQYTPRFLWRIEGDPEGFRMKLAYRVEGGRDIRYLKTDFGIYKKMN